MSKAQSTIYNRQSAIRRLIWLAPALIAVALGWAGWLAAGGLALDVGAPTDGAYLTGFYEREQGEYGVYRWSGAHAQVSLPAVRAPALLEIHMVGPDGGVPITLTFDDEPRSTIM